MIFLLFCALICNGLCEYIGSEDVWEKVGCNEDFSPENCNFDEIPLLTVEDFERCGPAMLNQSSRNYFLGASGRRISYNENKKAYRRIRIVPKVLRNVSKSSLDTETLGQKVSFPIGLSPVGFQKFAHPLGEIATVRAISNMGTIMILSSYASTTLEEVAKNAEGRSSHLWMQTTIFKNRTFTEYIVKRAERAGFEAIVITVDATARAQLTCDGRKGLGGPDFELVNLPGVSPYGLENMSQSWKDLVWIRGITKLPIVAKGILTASDAISAIRAGVSAVMVSNHGGRQMDSAPATIEALPDIVDAVNRITPRRDVYVDGGIRNGWDVYKAIASGAKMAFIGRPIIYGLAKEGESGVRKVVNILRKEFQEAMLLSGASNPSKISRDTIKSPSSNCNRRNLNISEATSLS